MMLVLVCVILPLLLTVKTQAAFLNGKPLQRYQGSGTSTIVSPLTDQHMTTAQTVKRLTGKPSIKTTEAASIEPEKALPALPGTPCLLQAHQQLPQSRTLLMILTAPMPTAETQTTVLEEERQSGATPRQMVPSGNTVTLLIFLPGMAGAQKLAALSSSEDSTNT